MSAPRLLWVSLQRQEAIGLRGNYCHQEDGPLLGQSRQEKEKQEGVISFLSLFQPPVSSGSYWWKLSGTKLRKEKFCFQSPTSASENKLEKIECETKRSSSLSGATMLNSDLKYKENGSQNPFFFLLQLSVRTAGGTVYSPCTLHLDHHSKVSCIGHFSYWDSKQNFHSNF